MMACFERLAHFDMAIDILNHHGRIVDQNADGQRQPAQGHDIDRLAEPMQADDGGQDGERDRGPDDDRGPP